MLLLLVILFGVFGVPVLTAFIGSMLEPVRPENRRK